LIAASAVLVVIALVLLIVGVFQTGLELVFASIAASIIAAISLFWGVLKDRRAPAGVPGYPPHEGAPVGGLTAGVGSAAAPAGPSVEADLPPHEEVPTLSGVGTGSSLDDDAPMLPSAENVGLAEPTLTLPEIPEEAPVRSAARRAAPRKPAAKKPAAKKPAAKKPAAKKPAAKKPAAKKPAAKKPAAKKPAAKKPAAKKPAAKKPAAKKTTRKPPAGS